MATERNDTGPLPPGANPACFATTGCWGADAAAGCPAGSIKVLAKGKEPNTIRCLPCVYPGTYCTPEMVLERGSIAVESLTSQITPDMIEKCPSGYFCPTSSVKVVCPAGYYCRSGSTGPIQCTAPLSICGEGMKFPATLLPFIVALIILVGGAILYWIDQRRLLRLALVDKLELHYSRKLKGGLLRALFRARAKVEQQQKRAEALPVAVEAAKSAAATCGRSPINATTTAADPDFSIACHRDLPSFKPVQLSDQISVETRNLCLVVRKTSQPLLRNVSVSLKKGKLNYIVGPSGCGKTTLLKVILDRWDRASMDLHGAVLINGQEGHLSARSSGVAFVPHEDMLPDKLAAHDSLTCAAALRCHRGLDRDGRDKRVEELERLLELNGMKYVRVTPLGSQTGLSSGQRRRLALATELLGGPAILLGDEVTSNVDATTAFKVSSILKGLARDLGVTVICVIHQPRLEVFRLADHMVMMVEGRVAYEGAPMQAADYFQRMGFVRQPEVNPCDFVTDIAVGIARRKGRLQYNPALLGKLWERHASGKGFPQAQTIGGVSARIVAGAPPRDGVAANKEALVHAPAAAIQPVTIEHASSASTSLSSTATTVSELLAAPSPASDVTGSTGGTGSGSIASDVIAAEVASAGASEVRSPDAPPASCARTAVAEASVQEIETVVPTSIVEPSSRTSVEATTASGSVSPVPAAAAGTASASSKPGLILAAAAAEERDSHSSAKGDEGQEADDNHPVSIQLHSPPPNTVRQRPSARGHASAGNASAIGKRAPSYFDRSHSNSVGSPQGSVSSGGGGHAAVAVTEAVEPSPASALSASFKVQPSPASPLADTTVKAAVAEADAADKRLAFSRWSFSSLRWSRKDINSASARSGTARRRTRTRLPDAGYVIVAAMTRLVLAVLALASTASLMMQATFGKLDAGAVAGGGSGGSTAFGDASASIREVNAAMEVHLRQSYVAFLVLGVPWLAWTVVTLLSLAVDTSGAAASAAATSAKRSSWGCFRLRGMACRNPYVKARGAPSSSSSSSSPQETARIAQAYLSTATALALLISVGLPSTPSSAANAVRLAFAVLAFTCEAGLFSIAFLTWRADEDLAKLRLHISTKVGRGEDMDGMPVPAQANAVGTAASSSPSWRRRLGATVAGCVKRIGRRSKTLGPDEQQLPSFGQQLAAFLRRALLQEAASAPSTIGVYVLLAVIGAAVGAVFRGVNWLSWTVKFLLVELIVMLTAATSGVTVVVAEKELSEHEAAAGTSILAYALAKQLVSLPLISLQPFFFLLAYIQGGEPYARWEMQFALLFVLAFAGSGLGNLVGVFAKKSPYLLVCIISIFVGVFNSYSPQFETLQAIGMSEAGARALLSWSPLRWTSEGLLLVEAEGLPPGWQVQREFLLKQYNYQLSSLTTGAVFIWPVLFGILARTAAAVGLYARTSLKR